MEAMKSPPNMIKKPRKLSYAAPSAKTGIVLHHTRGDRLDTSYSHLIRISTRRTYIGADFGIARDGTIEQWIDDWKNRWV